MIESLTARRFNKWTKGVEKELILSYASEFQILQIDGLGPVKADVKTMSTSVEAAGLYLSAKNGMRNIVLSIGFRPDYVDNSTITRLRRQLYEIFSPTMEIELEFRTEDLGPMFINGVVESHEPNIFTKDPTVQISIVCPNPYYQPKNGTKYITISDAVRPNFTMEYEGNIPTGFRLEYVPNAAHAQASISFYHQQTGLGFYLKRSMLTTDKYFFSTVRGDRYVEMLRSSARSSVLPDFSGSLGAVQLLPGRNDFQIIFEYISGGTLLLSYTPQYGGL